MKTRKKLNIKRMRRANRVAKMVRGTAERPRLVVSRSNRYVYAQIIDDVKSVTIVSAGTMRSKKSGVKTLTGNKSAQSFAAGEALGKKAVEKGIKTVVFDRRSAKFHGRVKSFADGAKKGGLTI